MVGSCKFRPERMAGDGLLSCQRAKSPPGRKMPIEGLFSTCAAHLVAHFATLERVGLHPARSFATGPGGQVRERSFFPLQSTIRAGIALGRKFVDCPIFPLFVGIGFHREAGRLQNARPGETSNAARPGRWHGFCVINWTPLIYRAWVRPVQATCNQL